MPARPLNVGPLFRTGSAVKFACWLILAIALPIIAYSGYQYLYFSEMVSTPLLPPSLAAEQPTRPGDYAGNAAIATIIAAVSVGFILYNRGREKRPRGFEVLKPRGGGPSAE